jgi:hypothetical protein
MRQHLIKIALILLLGTVSQAKESISYTWPSANNWEGGAFDVPTWFAPDMKVSGYEVLHFHEGYYEPKSVGHWSYVFALIVNELEEPDEVFLIEESRRYFVGLGRVLGDKKNKDLLFSNITAHATSPAYKSPYTGKVQNFVIRAFDSWESAEAIDLNARIYTWPCKGKKYRAIVYAVSPQEMSHPIWDQLSAEVHSFNCR